MILDVRWLTMYEIPQAVGAHLRRGQASQKTGYVSFNIMNAV